MENMGLIPRSENMLVFLSISTNFLSLLNRIQIKGLPWIQLSKFSFVGILNTLIGYGLYFILLDYTNYVESLAIAHIVGVTHSYVWNRYWVFKSNDLKLIEFIRFNSVYALVFISNIVMLFVFVDIVRIGPKLGQIIALPLITIISFAGHKHWSFRKN